MDKMIWNTTFTNINIESGYRINSTGRTTRYERCHLVAKGTLWIYVQCMCLLLFHQLRRKSVGSGYTIQFLPNNLASISKNSAEIGTFKKYCLPLKDWFDYRIIRRSSSFIHLFDSNLVWVESYTKLRRRDRTFLELASWLLIRASCSKVN